VQWTWTLLLATLLPATLFAAAGTVHASGTAAPIYAISPVPGSVIPSTTPTITAGFSTSAMIVPSSVILTIDKENVTGDEGFTVSRSEVSYPIPQVLALKGGNHTVTVYASGMSGTPYLYYWNFTVNPNATTPPAPFFSGVKPLTVVIAVGTTAAICGGAFGGYILYLRQTTRFTFRRYFATHHVKSQYYIVYLPAAAAFVFLIIALAFVYDNPSLPWTAPYYVFIIALFIGLTAFGIDARRQMTRVRAYERAFAQFLFEMADALRGGLDPAKALTELSKTSSNILRPHLRVAADGVRVGRPFDQVIKNMAAPMDSTLIRRYAGLIADASTVGGETAIVVYRAAKDMDDFVKIEEEREKQLLLPVAVVYIAFAVLMAVLFALLYLGPTLGSLNITIPSAGSLFQGSNATPTTVPRLADITLKERFFELMLINALGTGAIIGAFTEGRARYGILHSLGLIAATAIAFAILFP